MAIQQGDRGSYGSHQSDIQEGDSAPQVDASLVVFKSSCLFDLADDLPFVGCQTAVASSPSSRGSHHTKSVGLAAASTRPAPTAFSAVTAGASRTTTIGRSEGGPGTSSVPSNRAARADCSVP